ncbi:hypothetical protein MAPG_10313, partial [Magnaporthiopsis poae ATCC 64411]|uniref:Uncharacterized protein n=1 Tax=Magnaporthiopsis poae (strain ATCC 64411 / 73-15) TaxID=644358 RepID=A0A0C4EC98_MAGP6
DGHVAQPDAWSSSRWRDGAEERGRLVEDAVRRRLGQREAREGQSRRAHDGRHGEVPVRSAVRDGQAGRLADGHVVVECLVASHCDVRGGRACRQSFWVGVHSEKVGLLSGGDLETPRRRDGGGRRQSLGPERRRLTRYFYSRPPHSVPSRVGHPGSTREQMTFSPVRLAGRRIHGCPHRDRRSLSSRLVQCAAGVPGCPVSCTSAPRQIDDYLPRTKVGTGYMGA